MPEILWATAATPVFRSTRTCTLKYKFRGYLGTQQVFRLIRTDGFRFPEFRHRLTRIQEL
jgi:hypothetical protein